jgi:phosphoglycolate phosphatase
MKQYGAYLFDFDNTLYDTSGSMRAILRRGLPAIGVDFKDSDFDELIGMDLEQIFKAKCGDPSKAKAYSQACLTVLESSAYMSGALFEDTAEALKELKATGAVMAVVSGKQVYKIENLLERDGLLDIFDAIIGHESTARHKPHPDPILRCMHVLRLSKSDVLYVGDSPNDIGAAEAAGVDYVIVDRRGGDDDHKVDSLRRIIPGR